MDYLVLLGMGIVLGGIDVFPMIKQKLDRFSILSAFVFHLLMPFVVYGISWHMDPWLKGGCLYVLLALPMMIMVAKEDKKAVGMMAVSSCILGSICGYGMQFLLAI